MKKFFKFSIIMLSALLILNSISCANDSIDVLEEVATPTFSVDSGAVNSGTNVTISCATEGAKIYYTIDESEPTTSSTEYTSAINVTSALTIKAIAVKDGMNNSAVASASYTIKGTVATPVFSPASDAVNSGTSVTITCATEGAKIYYTTDGTEPTASSTEYTAAISVTPPVTIKAIAVKDGLNNSAVANASYTVKGTVAMPVFSIGSSAVNSGTSVTITCATEGAKIYYTTDGTEPTTSSTEYTSAISVTPPLTIKAIAVKDGMNDSAVASASYTVKGTVATPTFSVAEGAVNSGTNVTITCATEGAKIYYTTDGSEPTASSTEYTAAIRVTEFVTIKAIAVKDGMNDSAVASVSYTLKDFPLIAAGKFQMGSNQGGSDNMPVHAVTLTKSFYMCDHEVTQAEYEAVMGEGSNPSNFKTEAAEGEVQENRPVEMVSWYMAIVYCNKRSIKEGLTPCYTISGKTDPAEWGTIPDASNETWDAVECNWTADGYRLPTEAEWEYASRAGDNTVDALTWSGTSAETSLGNYAWYYSNAESKTHEVKKKAPNVKGLYDMSGNVLEWCWDWWGKYSAGAVTDPRGDSSGNYRVFRGGSYGIVADSCAMSFRNRRNSYSQSEFEGFRVCRTAN